MAKVFFEFSAGIGPLIRCLPVAKELRRRGHTVQYFSRDNSWQYMAAEGFERSAIDPQTVSFTLPKVGSQWAAADEFWAMLGFAEPAWLEDRVSKWTSSLARFAPDVVVGDFGVFSALSAREMHVPFIMITQSCYHPGVKNGRQRFWESYESNAGNRSTATRDCINAFLEKRKMPSLLARFEEIFIGDRSIIPGIPEFDELDGGPWPTTIFTGPILATELDGHRDRSTEDWYGSPSELPTVFCYTGRMRDWVGESGAFIFKSVSRALSSLNIRLVLATGGIDDAKQIPTLVSAPNVRVVSWMPMAVAMRSADVVIHHGGHGSCMGLLQFGVPGVIIPTQTEREYNARITEELGVGISIPMRSATSDLIVDAVGRLLTQPSFRHRAKHYAEQIAKNYPDPAAHAASVIESVM